MRGRVLFVAVVLLVYVGCGDDHLEGHGGLQHGDGYTLVIPDDWRSLDGEARNDIGGDVIDDVGSDLGGPIAAGFDRFWADVDTTGFHTNANVLIEALPSGMTLERYGRISTQNADRLDVRIDSGPTSGQLGGEPALTITGTILDSGDDATSFKAISAIHRGRAYTLTFSDAAGLFDPRDPTFRSIARSLRWVD